MNNKYTRKINQDFFKNWSSDMAYILGFVVADGCIYKRKEGINSYIFNITSKDKDILLKINYSLQSNYPIGTKYNSLGMPYSQIQICNRWICKDLINLGIHPRKTYNIKTIDVPDEYFPDFVRGFFDGDGTVYIYNVNGTPQIKSGFVSVSQQFIQNFNNQLCRLLNITKKSIHIMNDKRPKRMTQYSVCLYIDDSEKLAKFMYKNNPILFLDRKKEIFDKWQKIKRRHYKKENYPSKISWTLNKTSI